MYVRYLWVEFLSLVAFQKSRDCEHFVRESEIRVIAVIVHPHVLLPRHRYCSLSQGFVLNVEFETLTDLHATSQPSKTVIGNNSGVHP